MKQAHSHPSAQPQDLRKMNIHDFPQSQKKSGRDGIIKGSSESFSFHKQAHKQAKLLYGYVSYISPPFLI